MEIPAFKSYDFVPTDEPLHVQAPINEYDEILVEHPGARALPKIVLAIRIGLADIVVRRDDAHALQIRNAAAHINPHLSPVAFREPVPQLDFYKSPTNGIWLYDTDSMRYNLSNSHLLRPFSDKLFTFVLSARVQK